MENERETNQEVGAELDAFVAEFDADQAAAERAANEAVAPRGFSVQRGENHTRVHHNRTNRDYVFVRGSETFTVTYSGDGRGHRVSREQTFESYNRTGHRDSNDPDVRAVEWFRAAEANGQAFVN